MYGNPGSLHLQQTTCALFRIVAPSSLIMMKSHDKAFYSVEGFYNCEGYDNYEGYKHDIGTDARQITGH